MSAARSSGSFAAAVSRALAAAGQRPIPSGGTNREGIRVRRGLDATFAYVVVDHDDERSAELRAEALIPILEAAGYVAIHASATRLQVRKAAPAASQVAE